LEFIQVERRWRGGFEERSISLDEKSPMDART
jgi:hypothetical protein